MTSVTGMYMPADEAPPAVQRITLVRGVLRVVLFWWLATGAIFAMQRNAGTRVLSLLLTSALAVVGARLILQTRNERTVLGAERAFLGAALIWLWVATTFYGGWIIGPELSSLTADGPGFPLAMLALRATATHELLGVGMIALAYTVHGRNPVGWLTLVTFWGADQVARLNIFFGVASPGLRYLTPRLAFLGAFFGPEKNSALLLPSIGLACVLAAWQWRRVWRCTTDFDRVVGVLFGVLITLAGLEFVLLGLRWDAPFWDLFLRARGA